MRVPLRCDVVLEQTLGHVTHAQNLQRLLPKIEGFEPTFLPVEFEVDGTAARVPGYGNWTIRAGIRARRAVRHARRERGGAPDAMFVHTQVPAVLLGRTATSVPTVISLDATPRQYDQLGDHYAHELGHPAVEWLKSSLNMRSLGRARELVTWAAWTKRSLIDDYEIPADKVTVIPPGVDVGRWLKKPTATPSDDVVRILFVGGNLRRKGGDQLLDAFRSLRRCHGDDVELHLVTPTPVDSSDGVVVHANLTPNSRELIALYHRCDIFCLPTLGDCLPMVLPEAGAAGLTLVASDVGAISEIVRDGQTGRLTSPGDVAGLTRVLEDLLVDPLERRRLADSATRLVAAEHDASKNAARIVEIIHKAAGRPVGNETRS